MFAGYINPRTTRLATVIPGEPDFDLRDRAKFNTRDFDSFEAILQRYLRKQEARGVNACFAVSGPVVHNEVSSKYLPWAISGDEIARKFGFATVRLVNEHIAAAQGIFELKPEQLFSINPGSENPSGNRGLMVVDDRLCEALMVYDGGRYTTFTTAGGHTGFGPASQLEVELWQYLYAERDVVEIGDIVSRDGLVRIYDFFLDYNGAVRPDWFKTSEDVPALIIENALSGEDAIAVETVNLFVQVFAGEASNLALRGVTTGGMYLGGRIVSELMPALDQGRFLQFFIRSGDMEDRLSAMPVQVLMDRKTALYGAARLAAEQEADFDE
jgi:glucokinase